MCVNESMMLLFIGIVVLVVLVLVLCVISVMLCVWYVCIRVIIWLWLCGKVMLVGSVCCYELFCVCVCSVLLLVC